MSTPKESDFDSIWQDRDVRFDLNTQYLRTRPGEYLIEKIDDVEDTKGNIGDQGVFRVTNLRLMWHAAKMPRINLSIGYNAISGVTTRTTKSKLRGQNEALYLMASTATTCFEFIFTCSNPIQTKLFTTVIAIHRAYETTKLYRELKLRGAILDEDQLKILPLEEQYDRIEGVWNLSSDQSGEYVLGFRLDPGDKLSSLCTQIQQMSRAYHVKPIFGVQIIKECPETIGDIVEMLEDDVQIDDRAFRPDAFAAYFADGGKSNESRGPVYSEELGLAIEKLKEGFTLRDLWEINVE